MEETTIYKLPTKDTSIGFIVTLKITDSSLIGKKEKIKTILLEKFSKEKCVDKIILTDKCIPEFIKLGVKLDEEFNKDRY